MNENNNSSSSKKKKKKKKKKMEMEMEMRKLKTTKRFNRSSIIILKIIHVHSCMYLIIN
jgi:cytoskeletal protein RodZ